MPLQAQRLARVPGRAVAVLVVGVLLLQQVPLQPLAHLVTGGPRQGCTEQVCHCKEDRCTCEHCTEHGQVSSAHNSADTGDGGGPAMRSSCGTVGQGPLGVLVIAKTLIAPAPSAPALLFPAATYPLLCSALAPQRRADDIFHPPKRRIG